MDFAVNFIFWFSSMHLIYRPYWCSFFHWTIFRMIFNMWSGRLDLERDLSLGITSFDESRSEFEWMSCLRLFLCFWKRSEFCWDPLSPWFGPFWKIFEKREILESVLLDFSLCDFSSLFSSSSTYSYKNKIDLESSISEFKSTSELFLSLFLWLDLFWSLFHFMGSIY